MTLWMTREDRTRLQQCQRAKAPRSYVLATAATGPGGRSASRREDDGYRAPLVMSCLQSRRRGRLLTRVVELEVAVWPAPPGTINQPRMRRPPSGGIRSNLL